MEPTRAERVVALAVLALMLVHAIAGFLPSVPFNSWQMFVAADRYAYTLNDRDGNAIDLRDHAAPDAFLVRHQLPQLIAEWLARTRPEIAPLTGTVVVEHEGRAHTVEFTARGGQD